MENRSRAKVVYILPLYEKDTDTHFRYNYKLIEAASAHLDIFVIVEKAHSEVGLPKEWRVQKSQNPVLRFLELLFMCFKLHASGYVNVYVHYSYFGALTGIFSGMRVFYWNRGMPWLFRRSWFEEKIFRYILKKSILVISPKELAEEYKKHYGVGEYRILSNWIDLDEFKPQCPKEETGKKIILFVHHLSERKGADLIAKTASYFAGENIEFWVAGDGPYRRKLEEEAKSSPVPIKILGKIPNREIADYFRSAYIFFTPSREEGSPHVILEAMASGTPFVASDVGGIREIIPPEAEEFLCPSENVEAFAEKIKKLLRDSKSYAAFREAGLKRAQNFSKERGVKEFISILE